MLNPLIVAYSVQWFGSWNVPLYVMGALFLVGTLCWTLIDPTQASLRRGRRTGDRPDFARAERELRLGRLAFGSPTSQIRRALRQAKSVSP